MIIRVFEQGWLHQYDRMHRSVAKIGKTFLSTDDYDDAFYHACQDVWHLKDWIRNDGALKSIKRNITCDIEDDETLGVVADVANCTKHLVLEQHIHQEAILHSASVEVNIGVGAIEREICVKLKDGSVITDRALLNQALSAWEVILHKYRLREF